MKGQQYTFSYTMTKPREENGWMYLAEVPALPGCRAWGETAEEAFENLQSVACAFVESYRDHDEELPAPVDAERDAGLLTVAV